MLRSEVQASNETSDMAIYAISSDKTVDKLFRPIMAGTGSLCSEREGVTLLTAWALTHFW